MALALIVAAAEIGPDEATKNLEAWAARLGLGWPDWLTAGWVFTVLVVVAVVWYGILFRKQLRTVPRRSAAGYQAFRGLPPAPPEPPSATEIVAINDVRAAFRLAGAPAAERILSLCLEAQNDKAAKWMPFVWILEREKVLLLGTKERLEGFVGERGARLLPAIRDALFAFLKAYGTVVRAVHEFERVGVDLLDSQHGDTYQTWEGHHADLLGQLNKMKEQPALAHLRPVIKEHLSVGAELRYSTLVARAGKMFQSPSPDERAFLDLFCTDKPVGPDSTITHNVAEAGRQLARAKLLKVSSIPDGAQRFSLPEPVRQAWILSNAPPFPIRECVDIHPQFVINPGMRPGGGSTGVSYYHSQQPTPTRPPTQSN